MRRDPYLDLCFLTAALSKGVEALCYTPEGHLSRAGMYMLE